MKNEYSFGLSRLAYFVPRRCALWTTKAKFVTLVCLLWSGVLMIRADTHYVSLDGGNVSPYTNGWASAATEIQWAVDNAVVSDTVLVSNGTYNLTNQIRILTNITVKSLNGTNVTFVNGDNYVGKLVTNRCFYMTAGTLDGFTISNGFLVITDGSGWYAVGGGGIGIGGSATVKNCYIYRNVGSNCWGGGISVVTSGSGIISNCTVVSNTCVGSGDRIGGGIIFNYSSSANSLIIDSYIAGNAGGYCGGVAICNSGARMTNCTIAGNTAGNDGGGVRLENVTGVGAANCVISNNSASSYNGGLKISGSKCINSIIIGNTANMTAGAGVSGGGMLSNCQVIANTATLVGGVYLTGAAGSANVVANCLIARNSCAWNNNSAGIWIEYGGLAKNCLIYCNTNNNSGSGVHLLDNALYTNYPYGLINCTIVDNAGGAGIDASGYSNYVENCIVVSNTSGGAQYNIYNATAANTNNYWHTCAPNVLAPNQGNITAAPLFVDRPNYNYRLANNSPCINTGTNQAWMTNSIDLDGRTRIRYGTVDMGAYEAIYSGTMYVFY